MNIDDMELKIIYKKGALRFISIGAVLFGSALYAVISTTSLLSQFFSAVGTLVGLGLLLYGLYNWRKYSKPAWMWAWKEG